MTDCIFCKIVKGELPCHKIWEDTNHLAFLSIFPNTEGFSVVITKEHYPSYAFDLPDDVLKELVIASKKVAKLIDARLDDVERTGMIFGGFGIDHVHAKLFPMHGTKIKGWKPIKSNVDKYFKKYEGYISLHDYKRADDKKLSELAKRLGIDTDMFTDLRERLIDIRAQINSYIEKLITRYETNRELREIILKAIPWEGGHRGPFVYITSSINKNQPNLVLSAASELVYWADAGLDDVADNNTFRQSATSIRTNYSDIIALYASNSLYGIALANRY